MEFNFFKDYFKNDAKFIHKPKLNFEYRDKNGTKHYSIDSDLIFWTGKEQIIIKKIQEGHQFITNLGTIPKWAWGFAKPDDSDLIWGFVLHDGTYDPKQSFTKRVYCDWLMLLAHKVEGASFFKRWIIFLAVRIKGSKYYKR